MLTHKDLYQEAYLFWSLFIKTNSEKIIDDSFNTENYLIRMCGVPSKDGFHITLREMNYGYDILITLTKNKVSNISKKILSKKYNINNNSYSLEEDIAIYNIIKEINNTHDSVIIRKKIEGF